MTQMKPVPSGFKLDFLNPKFTPLGLQPSWLHLELDQATFETAGFMQLQPSWLHLGLNEATFA